MNDASDDYRPYKLKAVIPCSECAKPTDTVCGLCIDSVCPACHGNTWGFTSDCGHKAHGIGPCENETCQECCSHEYDHYICIYCEKEGDPGEDIDRAMDALEDR